MKMGRVRVGLVGVSISCVAEKGRGVSVLWCGWGRGGDGWGVMLWRGWKCESARTGLILPKM